MKVIVCKNCGRLPSVAFDYNLELCQQCKEDRQWKTANEKNLKESSSSDPNTPGLLKG